MTKRNTEAIDELRSVTEKSGDQVVVLTRALVVFTVVLVALTLALLVDAVAG